MRRFGLLASTLRVVESQRFFSDWNQFQSEMRGLFSHAIVDRKKKSEAYQDWKKYREENAGRPPAVVAKEIKQKTLLPIMFDEAPPTPIMLHPKRSDDEVATMVSRAMQDSFEVQIADLVPSAHWMNDRFPGNPIFSSFEFFGSEERSKLAMKLLRRKARSVLLQGPQGIGKSFFVAGLVQQLRICDPATPTVYLPIASFDLYQAIDAIQFAFRKSNLPAPRFLERATSMRAVRKLLCQHGCGFRVIIDQMHTIFRDPSSTKYFTEQKL